MFCNQCQETAKNVGCSAKVGVCGKPEEVSDLQDGIIRDLIRIAAKDKYSVDQGRYMHRALFATITNANFDAQRFTGEYKSDAMKYLDGEQPGVTFGDNPDLVSLKQLLLYGMKGYAAYADHALRLGYENEDIYRFTFKALSAIGGDMGQEELIGLVMECGETAVKAMALLDKANTETFGHQEPTTVNTELEEAPGILVSGHDLSDLKQLLEQTKGSGVNVYTHSEMLPANAYPEFKKYSHLKGNFGSAWHNQDKEFPLFAGPVLFTTNCIVPPKQKEYQDRIYTTNQAGYPDCIHITEKNGQKDFSQIIEHAKRLGNLAKGAPRGDKPLTIGFAYNAVMSVADKVVEAVKNGAIKRFVVMGGCDGRHKSRDYFREVAANLPKDAVILASGCASFRYSDLDLSDIGGIPRLLDAGQCNDSYSLALTALKLKEVFELDDINDLPISYDIAWYEQKAVAVLLALLSLGVKGIRLGPTLPGFLSENVAKVLVENFDIKPTGEVQSDIEMMMKGA